MLLTSNNDVPPEVITMGGGPMLIEEAFTVIQVLIRQGMCLCDIVRHLGVHPKTIRRALA